MSGRLSLQAGGDPLDRRLEGGLLINCLEVAAYAEACMEHYECCTHKSFVPAGWRMRCVFPAME